MQWTVRHISPVEVSGGQDQYYLRSSWHSEECNCECSGQSDVPPEEASGGQEQYYIRSNWHVQSCIRLAWHFEDADVPPVAASGGQEQYYIRSAWYLQSCIRSVWHFVDYTWSSSQVHAVYNIPSQVVKSTSTVLWSSANFCNISQNIHSKAPVASQYWKTNKVVWTWKDDWPPWELLHTKDLLPGRVPI